MAQITVSNVETDTKTVKFRLVFQNGSECSFSIRGTKEDWETLDQTLKVSDGDPQEVTFENGCQIKIKNGVITWKLPDFIVKTTVNSRPTIFEDIIRLLKPPTLDPDDSPLLGDVVNALISISNGLCTSTFEFKETSEHYKVTTTYKNYETCVTCQDCHYGNNRTLSSTGVVKVFGPMILPKLYQLNQKVEHNPIGHNRVIVEDSKRNIVLHMRARDCKYYSTYYGQLLLDSLPPNIRNEVGKHLSDPSNVGSDKWGFYARDD